MDEFEILIAIVVGLFKLVRWILKSLFGGLFGALGWLKRAQQGLGGKPSATRALPKKNAPAKAAPTPPPRPAAPSIAPALRQLADRLNALSKQANEDATRCAGEEANLPFVDSLRWLSTEAHRVAREAPGTRDPKQVAAAFAAGQRLEELFEVYSLMTDQRRDRALLELLGDADALAESCYRPVVDYCRQRGIKLVSDRTATCIGGDKLFILKVDDPSGLAPIVLPADWSTEIGWWPALVHEIGHDFFNSVAGLGEELRGAVKLPQGAGKLPGASARQSDVDAAVGSWMEELFADAFGTMMLGPAYVATMRWSFGSPSEPVQALAAAPTKQGTFEEHPPGHVRVAVGCRLLGQMGYGAIGDQMEAGWRRSHKSPSLIYFPTRTGSWITLSDEVVIERALEVGAALYQQGLAALSSFPLRSIPGLDFGPREHQSAQSVKDALLASRRSMVKDPRLVIAGAVLAWAEKPSEKARILKGALTLIDSVGVTRRRPVWAPEAQESSASPLAPDAALWRDAVMLDALLTPPRGSLNRRR